MDDITMPEGIASNSHLALRIHPSTAAVDVVVLDTPMTPAEGQYEGHELICPLGQVDAERAEGVAMNLVESGAVGDPGDLAARVAEFYARHNATPETITAEEIIDRTRQMWDSHEAFERHVAEHGAGGSWYYTIGGQVAEAARDMLPS